LTESDATEASLVPAPLPAFARGKRVPIPRIAWVSPEITAPRQAETRALSTSARNDLLVDAVQGSPRRTCRCRAARLVVQESRTPRPARAPRSIARIHALAVDLHPDRVVVEEDHHDRRASYFASGGSGVVELTHRTRTTGFITGFARRWLHGCSQSAPG
jgi:hypothetical protein